MNEIKITLTCSLVYEDKTTKELKTRLGYVMSDPSFKQNTEKFKGFAELSAFYDGREIFDKIPVDFYGIPVIATLETRPNPRNPLRETKIIKSIKAGNNVISLV